ncbi:MAG: putative ATP-binding domain protein 3, partial [Streblomastix strix]
LRGDVNRLERATVVKTGGSLPDDVSSIPELGGNQLPGLSCKVKPFKHCFQREIVLYAHFRNLLFFSVECSYAPQAFRGFAREFLVRMQQIYPLSIL